MSFEEMQAVLSGILQVQRQLQDSQLRAEDRMARFEDNMTRLEEGLAETKKIVESNARSILANAEASERRSATIEDQLRQLIRIVGSYAEATNQRLDILENQAPDNFE